MKIDLSWEAEKCNMKNIYVAITSDSIEIKDVPEGNTEIGYTTSNNEIYISKKNVITDTLSKNEAIIFRLGLFFHELLHQVLSDCSKHESIKNKSLAIINNCLEDPAIEYFAPQVAGGYLYDSLLFLNKVLFNVSGEITSSSPFQEFINAMICFGQQGKIKGTFLNPEAAKSFVTCLPLLWNGITNPYPKERFNYSKQIWEMTKPLWEKESSEQLNQMIQALNESSGGISSVLNSGTFNNQEIKMIPDANTDMCDIQQLQSNFVELLKGVDVEKEEELNTVLAMLSNQQSKNNLSSQSQEKNQGNESQNDFFKNEESTEFFHTVIQNIENAIKDASKEKAKEKKKKSKTNTKSLDVVIKDKQYESISISDTYVGYNSETNIVEYNSIVAKNLSIIKSLCHRLEPIIYNIDEEIQYKTSGKMSLSRLYSGTIKSRVFTRIQEPEKESDFGVVLLCDNSGSMRGNKIKMAQEISIILTEVFNYFNIPIYIMGYCNETKVKHNHYSIWGNKNSKYSLVNMKTSGNNFDGFSISYAKELLNKQRDKNKIFIIISDGTPNCSFYGGSRTKKGIADTKRAVNEMRKISNIIGVGICDKTDTPILHNIYGNDFILVEDLELLKYKIIQKLVKIIEQE